MTDARFPERWINDRRIRLLSDQAFRLFVYSLVWSVANRTDGAIHDDDLPLIPDIDQAKADELIKQKLWKRDADRWLIADYEDTQTSADDLDRLAGMRRAARERQRKHRDGMSRDSHVIESGLSTLDTVSRDSHVDNSRDTTRTGQDRHLAESELAGTSPVATCIASNCFNERRNGLRTCWHHAALETW